MSKYVIGLDLGINNVGWSIVDEKKKSLEKSGVRLFTASSTAVDRRTSRNDKRRRKRKHTRVNDLLSLFKSINFPKKNTIDSNLLNKRVLGLKERIDKQDIVNICCYYATHRGYIPFGDEDRKLITLNGLYPCEYYLNLLENKGKYRALEEVVDNDDLMKEFNEIINTQSNYYSELENIKSELGYIITRKRKFWEGPGSENSRTDYGRFKTENYKNEHGMSNDLEFLYDDMIGKCSICIGEKTVPVANYYYEVFNLLNDFINTSITSIDNLTDQSAVELDKKTGYYKLTAYALEKVINFCRVNPKLTYNKIYKELFGLKKEDLTGYRIDKDYKPLFSTMNFYRAFKSAFDGHNTEWIEDIKQYNEIIKILAIAPGIVESKKLIVDSKVITYTFSDEEYDILKDITNKIKAKNGFSYGSLSEKALIRAVNDMKFLCKNFMQVSRELSYDREAREYLIKSYNKAKVGNLYLMDSKYVDDIIASPQVKKSLRQSIKVINSIIVEKGEYPSVISVESTHEMNGMKRKNAIQKEQKDNEAKRQKASEFLINNFSESYVTDKNIIKVMLFNELDGRCPYCNKPFKDGINGIINSSMEIEHILPLSKSYNDSYDNKTLSCRVCNSNKGNKTPFQYLGSNFEEFSNRILKLNISDEKKNNFLETRDLDKYTTRFFNRNLRDTAYATSELINQINIFNDFIEEMTGEVNAIKTLSTPGQLTSKIRNNLNIKKDRDDGKYHHAVDASIVAGIAIDDNLGNLLIESQNDKQFWIKKKYIGQRIDNMILNYNSSIIESDLRKIKSDDDIKISYQVIKDANKSIANANIYKYIKINDEFKRVDFIPNIYDEGIMKDKTFIKLMDDSDDKYVLMIKDNNHEMFEKLKNIYHEYENKGPSKNPFVNYCIEVNDISKDEFDYRIHGIMQQNGPVIKKLRYYCTTNMPSLLEKKNIAKKSTTYIGLDSVGQAYTKVYWDLDKEKFIFLPIYTISIDFKTNKINKNDKSYQTFCDMYLKDKNYKFIVDLYNGNYIEVEKKNGIIAYGNIQYYDKTNNKIKFKNDFSFTTNDTKLIVYDVDYLGNKKERLTWPSK